MEQMITQKALDTKEPITVAFIATYPKMAQMLKEMVKGTTIHLLDIYASFDEAVDAAKRIARDVDVILTRGGTGHYIKTSVSIPVVSVPISPFDLHLSVSALPPEIKRVAFVNYQRPVFGVDKIAQFYGKEIIQYQFQNKEDLRQIASRALKDGCDIFLGGAEGVANACAIGMEAIEVVSGREAVYQALAEAIEIVNANRKAKKQATRLKSAFDALAEGICIADEMGKISVFNPAAVRMFGLSNKNMIGENILDTPVGASAVNTFDCFEKQVDRLEKVLDITVNTNHIPIYLQQEFIGTVSTFQDVSKIQRLEGQIRRQLSQKGFAAKYTFDDILTQNRNMVITKKLAKLYAQTDSAVLIEGESGTGKELFAHSIHNASICSVGPFVTINCAAIPEQLLESELFGYAPGAFTGARKEGKPGIFELAHNGTIFLDEIGEMPKYLQARLLRVLQEKEVMRVGDDKIISINCRIISATNKNLAALVEKGEFREDLYYRLSTFSINVVPLRKRQEDIPLLCEKFLDDMNFPKKPESMRKSIIEQIQGQGNEWLGNIRELQSICSRFALIQTLEESTDNIRHIIRIANGKEHLSACENVQLSIDSTLSLKAMLEEAEKQYIAAILKKHDNNQSQTARQLEIGRTTLWRKIGEKQIL